MTPLNGTLKRALLIKGEEFVLTLTPLVFKVTRKGRRRGVEVSWESLIRGDQALTRALQASVAELE